MSPDTRIEAEVVLEDQSGLDGNVVADGQAEEVTPELEADDRNFGRKVARNLPETDSLKIPCWFFMIKEPFVLK